MINCVLDKLKRKRHVFPLFQAKEAKQRAAQAASVTSPKSEKCEKNYSTCCFSHVRGKKASKKI
jgi:hypothetical protein